MREPLPHTLPALKFLNDAFRGGTGAGLFMEMRLCKTATIIKAVQANFDLRKNPALVLCPVNGRGVWAGELEEEDILDYIIIQGIPKKKKEVLRYDYQWVICTYESAMILELHMFNWACVIIDESLKIANPKPNISKYYTDKYLGFKYKYVLNGNFVPENLLQVFNQLKFVYNEFMGCFGYYQFRHEYFNEIGYDWYPKKDMKTEIYKEIRKKAYVLTRKEAKIGDKKFYQKRKVFLTEKQRKAYNEMLKKFEADGVQTKYATVRTQYMQKICGGVKLSMDGWHSLNKFNDIILSLQGEFKKEQVIMWFKYKHELFKMSELLEKKKITYVPIHGDLTEKVREINRGIFKRGKAQVGLMTIKAEAKTQNYSNAKTAIYFSNECSCDLRTQSEDRMIGMTDLPRLIIDYCVDKTIDNYIVELLRKKKIESRFFMSNVYAKLLEMGFI